MNSLTFRMILYTVATMAAAAGFGTFDAEAGTLTLNLNEIAASLAAAGGLNALVVWIWGTKPTTGDDA